MLIGDDVLDAWLREDAPFGDLTTELLGIGELPGRIRFTAAEDGVVCCIEEAARLLGRCGAVGRCLRDSGDHVAVGTPLLEADGPAAALHLVWRAAGTLIECASGIASATRRIVAAARAVAPAIAVECTRKAPPGTRALAARAVQAGGGSMHRLGLSESILIFPQHWAFLGGIEALGGRLTALGHTQPGRRIVVEARSLADALILVAAGAEVIQLDKLSPEKVAAVVAAAQAHAPARVPLIMAAGGINALNAAAYAATGCAALVTSAPYWAPPLDIAVSIEPLKRPPRRSGCDPHWTSTITPQS